MAYSFSFQVINENHKFYLIIIQLYVNIYDDIILNVIPVLPILIQLYFLKIRVKPNMIDSYFVLKLAIFYSKSHLMKIIFAILSMVLSLISLFLILIFETNIYFVSLFVKNIFININQLLLGFRVQFSEYGRNIADISFNF